MWNIDFLTLPQYLKWLDNICRVRGLVYLCLVIIMSTSGEVKISPMATIYNVSLQITSIKLQQQQQTA